MKKYLILLFATLSFSLVSCDDDTEPGGTAVEKMAGDWWVTYMHSVEEYDYIFNGIGAMPDENDVENWDWDYIYSEGHFKISTYNTAANVPTEMFIDNPSSSAFATLKVKAAVEYNKRTFECPTTANLAKANSNITIIKGQILEGAATTPSGMPADSIIFYVKRSDDQYGFTYAKVSGFRRTGFPADDF